MDSKQSNFDFSLVFRERTKQFAVRVMKMIDRLPTLPSCRTIGGQLVRSSSSTAANYRAACRARSDREFASKLHIALEEADETVFWLEMLVEGGNVKASHLDGLLEEAQQILAIVSKAEKTVRERQAR